MGDKIRPGRITDEQVEAFDRAASAMREAGKAGPGYVNAIRAGLLAAYTRRELENRTRPTLHPINLDPYPGTVSEVADEIARFVLELESAGIARGVAGKVLDRIRDALAPIERKTCKIGDHRDGRDAATARVRYQNGRDGAQRWTVDMCDRHAAITYARLIRDQFRNVEIMPAGWTPEADCTHGADANMPHNLDAVPVLDVTKFCVLCRSGEHTPEQHRADREAPTCKACPPECRECTGRNEDCECYTHVPADSPLHGADPDCAHVIVVRMSGYGCTKCNGGYCA